MFGTCRMADPAPCSLFTSARMSSLRISVAPANRVVLVPVVDVLEHSRRFHQTKKGKDRRAPWSLPLAVRLIDAYF
jgi:hypothetical protein